MLDITCVTWDILTKTVRKKIANGSLTKGRKGSHRSERNKKGLSKHQLQNIVVNNRVTSI
jgi:hypothetical protein